MDAVVEAAGARRLVPELLDPARGQPGLLQQLAPAALDRTFTRVDHARRQLPRVSFDRRTVLPNDGNSSAARQRDDRYIIGLHDRVKGLRRSVARKLDLARDDAHPRRDLRRAARADARPFHGLIRCLRWP